MPSPDALEEAMRRREFIAIVGWAAAATWPLAVHAQRSTIRRVGMLMNNVATDKAYVSYMDAFVKTLQTLGWRDGENLRLDVRWTAGDPERIHSYAVELVALAPDLIVASSTANLKALLPAAKSIPIVFVQVSDPVAQGFVSDLSHPDGNITGIAAYEFSMGGKWLDLLKQMAPNLARVAVIFNPETSPQSKLYLRAIDAVAQSFKVQVIAAPTHDEAEIEQAIATLDREPNGGLLIPTDTFTALHMDRIIDLAARHRLPAIYQSLQDVIVKGGLMYYGIDFEPQFRQAAIYVDRILKGAKPGELPIQLASNFKLVLNLKTARALGIEVPMELMLRADEMVE
jgi:putative ABC transport system substrate-binding protein